MGSNTEVQRPRDKEESKFKPSVESLSKIIKKVLLEEILLESSCVSQGYHAVSGDIVPGVSAHGLLEKSGMDLNRQARFGVEVVETTPVGDMFWVICHYGARELVETSEDELVELWTVEASFRLLYRLKNRSGITKDDVMSFGVVNGPYHSWPYWREYLQNTTMRMGIDGVVLQVKPPPVESFQAFNRS